MERALRGKDWPLLMTYLGTLPKDAPLSPPSQKKDGSLFHVLASLQERSADTRESVVEWCVSKLVQRGVPINTLDAANKTPLDIAIEAARAGGIWKYPETGHIMRALRKAGARMSHELTKSNDGDARGNHEFAALQEVLEAASPERKLALEHRRMKVDTELPPRDPEKIEERLIKALRLDSRLLYRVQGRTRGFLKWRPRENLHPRVKAWPDAQTAVSLLSEGPASDRTTRFVHLFIRTFPNELNTEYQGQTLLSFALEQARWDDAFLLLAGGADPDISNCLGKDGVHLLVDRARLQAPADARLPDGFFVDLAAYMVLRGAQLKDIDMCGMTPYNAAASAPESPRMDKLTGAIEKLQGWVRSQPKP